MSGRHRPADRLSESSSEKLGRLQTAGDGNRTHSLCRANIPEHGSGWNAEFHPVDPDREWAFLFGLPSIFAAPWDCIDSRTLGSGLARAGNADFPRSQYDSDRLLLDSGRTGG